MSSIDIVPSIHRYPVHTSSGSLTKPCAIFFCADRPQMTDQSQAGAQAQNAKDGIPELPKPEMHIVDMSKAEVDFAIEVAKKGIVSLFKNERRSFCEVAQFIKKEFDKTFQGTWHVFVGKHFGAWVSYETHKLVYFHIGQAGFMIYKHG